MLTAVLVAICLARPADAGAPRGSAMSEPVAAPGDSPARVSSTSAASSVAARQTSQLAGTLTARPTVQQAVDAGAATAARKGITTYATVIDRSTGRVVGRTGNDGTQVASESLVKMFLAAYYLVRTTARCPLSSTDGCAT